MDSTWSRVTLAPPEPIVAPLIFTETRANGTNQLPLPQGILNKPPFLPRVLPNKPTYVPVRGKDSQPLTDSMAIRKFWPLISRLRSAKASTGWAPHLSDEHDLQRLTMDPSDYNGHFESYVHAAHAADLVNLIPALPGTGRRLKIVLIDRELLRDDPAFDSLVAALDAWRRAGVDHPSWSQIGEKLDLKTYGNAGVSKLGTYLELAYKAGVIQRDLAVQAISPWYIFQNFFRMVTSFNLLCLPGRIKIKTVPLIMY